MPNELTSVSTFSPHLFLWILAYRARSVYAGPFLSCVPPEPNATPAAAVGLRNIDPRTECDSRSGNHSDTRLDRSEMPTPARHTTRSPPSMGNATSRSRMDRTTRGRTTASASFPRGTDPPVNPVLAPWGRTTHPASTIDWRQRTASPNVWGLTTARADPRPRRAPLRYGAFVELSSNPEMTLDEPTIFDNAAGRALCSGVISAVAAAADADSAPGGLSHEQHDRGRPLGRTRTFCGG
mmetsp:Transcript_18627/g.53720  ORF Transcript_18627/g.53720 Transcript_18627/m.53720 type:complete len:238 (+) Transcript_18627:1639-2352(+)